VPLKPSTALLLVASLALAVPAATAAAEETVVRVDTFPNAKALPLQVGVEKGIFARHGLKVDLAFTRGSRQLRDGLASGKFDVVHAAVDNALDMIEVGKQDVVIVTGGDSGTNEFMVQGDLKSFADMRGRILVVDAANTAYALQAKKILLTAGLKEGDYTVKPVGNGGLRLKAMLASKDNAGAILNLPFTVQGEQKGLRSLGRTTDLLGPYQAAGAFVMRPWAKANAATLERYIAGYIESMRWVYDPKNRDAAVAMLMDKLKLAKPMAERTYTQLIEPSFGLAPDAKFNVEGFKSVLALRAEIEAKGAKPAAPDRYIDLSYYDHARQQLGH
jgi:ABC-type nitrate/sulfonate/bicarbonate transport system substrate-binding protein